MSSIFKILHIITIIIALPESHFEWHYPWSPQLCTSYLFLHWSLVPSPENLWLATSLCYLAIAIIYRKPCEFFTLRLILAYRSDLSLDEELITGYKTWSSVFDFALSWSICNWDKLSCLMHSCKNLRPDCELTFAVDWHKASFANRLTSISFVFL